MKEMRRILALVLCFVMLVGVLPVSALATDTVPEETPVVETTEVPTDADDAQDEEIVEVVEDEEIVEDVEDEEIVEDVEDEEVVEDTQDEEVIEILDDEIIVREEQTTSDEATGVTGSVVVVAGSDYQKSTSGTTMSNIATQIKEDYASPYGILMGGDYDAGDGYPNSSHLTAVDNTIASAFPTIAEANRIMIQGNHETYGSLSPSKNSLLDATGAHDTDYYGVYAINYEDFGSASSGLNTYLAAKAAAEYTKPIFVLSHQPLHATSRGDNTKAVNLFNVLNNESYDDLCIIFLFGHNHSQGYDAYLGNGSIYLPEDSSITVAGGSTSTLNFTYMNYGYVGYVNGSACTHLTMTAFEIYEDEVIVKRYDENGEHNCDGTAKVLKAAGVSSGGYSADTSVVYSGAVIELGEPEEKVTVENTDKTVSVTAAGLTGLTVEKVSNPTYDTEVYEAFASYDITPDGYTQGKTATVTITLDEADGFDASRKVVVIDEEKGTETEKTIESGKVTFTTTHFSTYSIAQRAVDTGSGSTGGGTTVTPEGGDWVTISSGVGGTIYTLDTNGVTTGENYLIVSAGADGTAYALRNNNGSVARAEVTISNGQIVTDAEDIVWTYDSSKYLSNGSHSFYLSYNNTTSFLSTSEQRAVAISAIDQSEGSYSVKRDGSYYAYYLNYSESAGFTNTGSNGSAQAIYFFVESGTQAAGDALYGKIDGELTYTVPYGADENTVKGIVQEGITILYHTGDASAAQSFPDDVEGMSWTLDPNYNGEVPGEYALTIKYNDVVLGTVKVIVPNVGIEADDILYYIDESLTAPINAGLVEGTTTGGSYTYEVVEGGDAIIDSIDGNGNITFTGTEGTAQVKITYTYAEGDTTSTLEKTINVTATEPYYTIDIMDGENVVTGTTITKKGVTDTTTLQLGTEIAYFGPENSGTLEEIPAGATLAWSIPEEYQHIATVDQNGLVSFKGVNGAFYVTVTLTVDGEDYTAGVNISATTSQYSVPTDGTVDFPEYPNEGAIRFDKTATAVGNFSETGIAQVELSMTGVPYTAGSEIDVVIMLDRSRSMNSTRINATVAATEAFIKGIVKNEDGSYNGNRIYLGYFMGETTYDISDSGNIGGTLVTIDNDTEFNALIADLTSEYKAQMNDGGTDWQIGLDRCENLLDAAKTDGTGNNRPQFCVFMSDGAPGDYVALDNNSYDHTTGSDWVTSGSRNSSYQYELYSTRMKGEKNITIYSVLLGETGTQPQFLMNDLSGAAGETTNDTGSAMSKKDKYYYNVPDADAATEMENVFSGIAVSILQAATNVTVEDKITDQYTMIFDIPEGTKDITGVTNDFYIEFGKYTLDADHERTEEGFTSVTKLYLQNTSGTLSAKDATDPVFEQKVIGEKGTVYYWTTNSSYASKAAVTYTVDGTAYYFIPYGMEKNADGTAPTGWYNMTSGAYATGTVDATTNMSDDLVIATPYFVYNASTRMLYWTVEKLDTAEYALRYFLYLDDSATEVGTDNETDPGSYPTNEHAYITYTNFRDNDCQQEFPVPQLTWSGAQVSYVFYLVNSAGQPINKSGQVVDFANATFVTDIYTENTVWNKGEDGKITADSQLGINWLAEELLPSDYKVYDENAQYRLHVYGNHDGTSNFDYFTIAGNDAATISESLNNRLDRVNTTADAVSLTTTKVYNTKAGQKITGYGTYTSEATDSITDEIVLDNFDFYNTTVAFAVVWQPALVSDTVVVDYGLDVLINVVANDLMQNTVTGIGLGNEAYGSIAMNTGVSTTSKLGTAALSIDGNTISIENENAVRFSQGDMEFKKPVNFYYESPVEFYENSDKQEGYMYSSVTVIPATTIYYEDDFVELKTHKTDGNGNITETTDGWPTDSVATSATQAQDRPGASQISATLDADNNYGYDAAYAQMASHSLNNAAMIHVDANTYGSAKFTFYGTGFDVISMTSNTTGTLLVNIKNADTGVLVKNLFVDTYYGYSYSEENGWYQDANNPNALYQVPVIKATGLGYGHYEVEIRASYNSFFDHTSPDGYDLYLDAIRIYDPTGNQDDTANKAYEADGEGWPAYQELRNNIIAASNYTVTENEDGTVTVSGTDLPGAIFIDCNDGTKSIADYVSYGPNNELYLAQGQSIAFKVNPNSKAGYSIADVQLGIKSATGAAVDYTINGAAKSVATATDMYYSIMDYAFDGNTEKTVTITNSSTGTGDTKIILSLTNIKVTYKADELVTASEETTDNGTESLIYTDEEVVTYALMSLRAPAVEEDVPETTVPETTVPEETEPETEETKPSKPGKPNKEDKPEKETKPSKPDKEDKDDKETKPTKPSKPNKPAKNNRAEEVRNNMNKVASAIKNVVTSLLGRWFR